MRSDNTYYVSANDRPMRSPILRMPIMARFAQTSMTAKELVANHHFCDKLLTYAVCCFITEMREKSRKSGSGILKKI